MNACLKSLTLLAALPLCLAAMNQEATAEDRFDVKVEVLDFKAFRDTTPKNWFAKHEYEFEVNIEGIAIRFIKGEFNAWPKRTTAISDTLHFKNIKKPEKSNRRIKFMAKARREYTVNGLSGSDAFLRTRVTNNRDLFRESDRSGDDVAVETIAIENQDFVFNVRVTVIEVD